MVDIKAVKTRILSKPLSLFTWLMALIVIMSITSMSLIIFNYNFYKNEKEIYINTIMKKNDRQTLDYINNLLTDIESIILLPLFSTNNTSEFFSAVKEYENTGEKNAEYRTYINQVLRTLFNYKTNTINSVFFYTTDGSYDYLLRGTGDVSEYKPDDEEWFLQSKKDMNGIPVLFGSYKLYKPQYSGSRGTYVLGLARSVIDVQNSKIAGVLQVNINESQINNLLKNNLFLSQQRILITDSDNRIISDTESNRVGTILNDEDLINTEMDTSTATGNRLVNISKIGWTEWKLINIIPLESINAQINATMSTTLAIMFFIILLAIGLAFSIIIKVVSPIKKLTQNMSIIGSGRFDVSIHEYSLKETMLLSEIFNKMAEELNNNIKRQYIDKINQKDLEIKMLQYQINPHFIYNSMESIKMISLLHDDHLAAQMMTSLGKIMRYSLSDPDEVVTIRHEISMIEEYIALQTLRFNDLYQFYFNIDREIYDYYTPKLILQPLIENAIEHGMSNTLENGEIFINGYLKDETIILEVCNNGELMSAEKLNWLNVYINDDEQIEEHIGLKNINRRIKLFFGSEYGVKIYSTSLYLTAQITIPKKICNAGDKVC